MNREHPSHLNASVLTFNSIILLILWFFDCVQCSFACFITFAFQCVISQHVNFVVCFTAIDIQWNFLCLYDLDSRINWKFKIDVVLINWMYRWLNPHLKKKKAIRMPWMPFRWINLKWTVVYWFDTNRRFACPIQCVIVIAQIFVRILMHEVHLQVPNLIYS